MDGKLLVVVCLVLLGTVHGYTLRDILRERGMITNCLTTVIVNVQTPSNRTAWLLGEKFESRLSKFTVVKLFILGRTPNL